MKTMSSYEVQFFWNKSLLRPFLHRERDVYALPVMQGFVGQRDFTLSKCSDDIKSVAQTTADSVDSNRKDQSDPACPQDQFLLTLVSRRSVERPGLRYLRRGIDEDGNTANFVETEQLLSSKDWSPARNIYSFLQIRGSIPLFFSQSPYSFKPVPVLQHSQATNLSAFRNHFEKLVDRYGDVQIVLLTDKGGPEGAIGQKYEDLTQLVNSAGGVNQHQIGFEWFDFHRKCSGMRFDNVQLLVDNMRNVMANLGQSVDKNGLVQCRQTGLIRTNCMDCLDRTNVVQSGLAQRALEEGLQMEGSEFIIGNDTATQSFNSLWADNGDAISKQYSSTAALKSDYTRTRKRTYRGAVNDLSLTMSRYFNNIGQYKQTSKATLIYWWPRKFWYIAPRY